MKKVYIVHGWGGHPQKPLYKYVKDKLEETGFNVVVPKMPNSETPTINSWIGKLNEVIKSLDEEDILIGHSVGCQAVLRYLEQTDKGKVGKVFLIAPWMHLDKETIEEEGEEVIEIARPWMETPIDWENVKIRAEKFVAIFSDDDPFVPLSEEELFKENLGAETYVLYNKEHFDPPSGAHEFPEIFNIINS